VTVIYQGREGRGAGPDFSGAVIAGPSSLTLRGDIELHVRASSFRAHGHDRDRAYNNVILHVVFEDDVGADTPLFGGGSAPVVALAPWVSARAGELERWLAQPLLWREPCHDALVRMGAAGVAASLEVEGDRRFAEKTERMQARIGEAGVDQALYEGLLEALGYGGNAGAMLALARILPWSVLAAGVGVGGGDEGLVVPPGTRSLRHLEPSLPGPAVPLSHVRESREIRGVAMLLGSAGLLPSQRGHDGPLDTYVQDLEREFGQRSLPSLSPSLWKLWGVRPENTPARRIAGAAALLRSLFLPGAIGQLAAARTVNEAISPLIARASGYWLRHYDVYAGPCRLPPAFIGRSRALEILTNVVLPAAAASGDIGLSSRAQTLFAALPRPASYGQTRFIEAALASKGIRIPINARRAQGMLALNRDWCTQGGCGRCPLS